jgi:lipoprotein-releasing system ATP-binding protein
MLICKNVCKAYDDGNMKVSVLNNLNLEIKSGESISIIGASGSGKSTLLHVLSSLDRADSGDIILDNLLLSEINENELCKIRLRKIGFIYQFHHLINELTVKENIALPLMIDKKNKSEISSSINKVIEQVDLKKRENFQIEKLSGGERQRVAIARSIVHDPKIIFADEPTGNLDKNNARNIFALLNDLANYNKSSLLMATHDLDIASKLNKSLILENGTLIEGNI